MFDGLDNEIQAGDIIVAASGSYQNRITAGWGRAMIRNSMVLGQVSNFTPKGLSFHPLRDTGGGRQYLYDPHAIAVISTGHRHQSLKQCREAYSLHAWRNKNALDYYDIASNRVEVDAVVAFTYRDDKDLSFGYVKKIIKSPMSETTGSYKLEIQPFGSSKITGRHMSQVARVLTSYEDLNPALVSDLLGMF